MGMEIAILVVCALGGEPLNVIVFVWALYGRLT